jgi:hypothetical protein
MRVSYGAWVALWGGLLVTTCGAVFGNACGSSGGSSTDTLSCTLPNTGNVPGSDSCTDYLGGWPATTVMGLCSIPGTQYAASACPHANSVGGCSGAVGPLKFTTWYYPSADASATPTSADVMASCTAISPPESFTPP